MLSCMTDVELRVMRCTGIACACHRETAPLDVCDSLFSTPVSTRKLALDDILRAAGASALRVASLHHKAGNKCGGKVSPS